MGKMSYFSVREISSFSQCPNIICLMNLFQEKLGEAPPDHPQPPALQLNGIALQKINRTLKVGSEMPLPHPTTSDFFFSELILQPDSLTDFVDLGMYIVWVGLML